MSNADFQNRIARLNQKHAVTAEQSPDVAREPVTRAAMQGADRAIALELMAIPLFLVIGFATPILARMVMFHYVSDGGYYEASGAGLLSGLLGDIGIEMMVSGLIVVFLFIKNLWLPLAAHAVGGYFGMWRELDAMRMFPDLWGMLYSPQYVAETLFFAEQFPQYY